MRESIHYDKYQSMTVVKKRIFATNPEEHRSLSVPGIHCNLLLPEEFNLPSADEVNLRFALASDGHYGQPDTNYAFHHDNMVDWLNKEQVSREFDFTVINGDLFHNDPSFLPKVKTELGPVENAVLCISWQS